MHSCIHSCALLQPCTVAISPPLASSPPCDCYWKCSAATGASSWRIYMTQVHALESIRVCMHKHTHTHTHTYQKAWEWTSPQRLDLMSATSCLHHSQVTTHFRLKHTHTYTHTHAKTETHTHLHASKPLRAVSKPGWYHPAPLVSTAWLTSSDSDFWLCALKMTKMSLILT